MNHTTGKPVKRVKKILVPLDGSRNSFRALDFAMVLAKPTKAGITGFYCVDLPLLLEYGAIDPVASRLEKKAKRFMANAKKQCQKNRIEFTQKVIHGKASQKIVQFSKKGKFDVIVMGSKGQGMVKEMLLGSVSYEVTHTSKIPIVIVR